jgi:hypothetical protein
MPPLWSCAAVTLAVLLCVAGVAAAFLALGGQTPPAEPLRLTILTAPPELLRAAQTDPQSAGIPTVSVGNSAGVEFVMTGPTLPAVVFTATPEQIAIGKTVEVIDVGDQQLNVREQPGIVDVDIVFRAPEGSRFIVGDGPSQGDGLTWWRIDDPSSGRSGWAASNYLVPVALE